MADEDRAAHPPAAEEAGAPAHGDVESPATQGAGGSGEVAGRTARAERIVGALFGLGTLALLGFATAFTLGVGHSTQVLGVALGVGIGSIGAALVAWGKYLTPQGPFVQEREILASPIEARAAVVQAASRFDVTTSRRRFLAKLAGLAAAVAGVALLFPLRSLGPQPKKSLDRTNWRRGSHLVRPDGTPIRVDELEVGGVTTVFPGDIFSHHQTPSDTELQVDQTILLRAATRPVVTRPGRETWSPAGYLAFSKVCTHAGCPVGLYEERTHQLLCPCHQSLFDVLSGATPVFGPAPRPLPQLPLYVDADGYLRAQAGYDQPIGPGFWERS